MIRQDRMWTLHWTILVLVVALTVGVATLTDAQERKRTVAEIQADIDKLQVELKEAEVTERSLAKTLWDMTLEEAAQMAQKSSTRPLEANEKVSWNLRFDVEKAYWNLWYAYSRLESLRSGRDVAYQTWQQTKTYKEVGDKRGGAQNLAQTEQNYLVFRQQTELAQNNLFKAEATLRYILRLAPADGRLIRPIDNPVAEPIKLDWHNIVNEVLFQSPERANQLGESFREISLAYLQMQTTLAFVRAANNEVEAVQNAYDAERTTLDQVLQAQRRQLEANTSYYGSVIDYNLAFLALYQ